MKCKNCGIELEEAVSVCPSCGESLDTINTKTDEQAVSNVNTAEASNGWFWLGFIFTFYAIIVGAILKNKRWPSLGGKLFKGGLVGTIFWFAFGFILGLVICIVAVAGSML